MSICVEVVKPAGANAKGVDRPRMIDMASGIVTWAGSAQLADRAPAIRSAASPRGPLGAPRGKLMEPD
jgi:hypothetical protein